MSKIQAKPDHHLSSGQVNREIDLARFGFETISEGTAGRIASWFQSSGTTGSVLASLASGRPVERAEVFDDLARTLAEVRNDTQASLEDKRFNLQALHSLVLWALDAPEVD